MHTLIALYIFFAFAGPIDPNLFTNEAIYEHIGTFPIEEGTVMVFYTRKDKGEPSSGYVILKNDGQRWRLITYGYKLYGTEYQFDYQGGKYVQTWPVT